MAEKIYIVLQNGEIFEGKSFGATGEAIGEIVFTTGMTGFVETLTDPNYYGQIVVQTFPTIGNYGIMNSDKQSDKSFVSAYVVRDFSDTPSNFRMDGDIDTFLKEMGIIGVYGVDTRAITRTLRDNGTMNAKITTVKPENLDDIKAYTIKNAVEATSGERKEYFVENATKTVALLNLGNPFGAIKMLNSKNINVISLPYNTKACEILDLNVDALVISDGPGNPTDNPEAVGEIAAIAGKLPILALGLGHQIFALSQGAKINKLCHGHRGANQPAMDKTRNRIYITCQNHGYAVDNETVCAEAEITHYNVNDGSCEGIYYPNKKAITVQFIPDAFNGKTDSDHVLEGFMKLIEG